MAAEAATFFHRTGATLERTGVGAVDAGTLRPALFGHVHDLTRLRYDFPLVLADDGLVETLSGRIDALLAAVAPSGAAGDRMRRLVLRLEREIRSAVTAGGEAGFEAAWDAAVERVGIPEEARDDLARAREQLALDGRLVDCTAWTPGTVVEHAWRAIGEVRARERLATFDALARRLAGLAEADFVRSAPGRSAERLRAGVGDTLQGLFDFEAMAQLLAAPSGPSALSPARRGRIEDAVAALRGQRFFGGPEPYEFAFDSVDAAVEAYEHRLPEMARLVRAQAIAELELRGAYVEAEHDAWFRDFGPAGLRPEDQSSFPDYLVRLDAGAVDAAAGTPLLAALASGAPLKVVVAFDDPFGFAGQLAESAMGLGDVFVLQATASQLFGVRDRVRAALEYRGPALLAVFTGALRSDLLPYLVAAAALEARVVPSFTCDPSAGPDFAQRLTLHDNPQPDRPWPVHELSWADEALQRTTAEVAFTPADFAICDPRQAAHFARVPRAQWDDASVPMVFALDAQAGLHKLVVDQRLARTARRHEEAWHRLRELDALKRPPAAALVARAEVATAVAASPEVASPEAAPPEAAAIETTAHAPEPEPEPVATAAQPVHSRDDAYIETARCTTCNECTGVNARVFAYNANGQATIADAAAGTYRDLVEAAERCQVAIIHPGKPRDPAEPGLAELLERAEPFR